MDAITNNLENKIYLLSDTHLIADELHDNGSAFQRMRDTSAGKDLDYQTFALKAFVHKILKEKPLGVIITGDLTFNGAKLSAETLAKIFSPLTKAGIHFWVVPGNHDIYDGWARKFVGPSEYRTEEINPADWKKIFKISYQDAISSDTNSLAYSVNLNKDYRLIFADSNIYENSPSSTAPKTNGQISQQELLWIENELQQAQANHQHVLFFMHHNLYKHNMAISNGFTLDNASELKNIFQKYQVQFVASGHMHAQSIIGPSENCPATEVASSCFAMLDQGYGIISLSPEQLTYQRYPFVMQDYLNEKELNTFPSGDFQNYLKNIFYQTNEKQMSWLNKVVSDDSEKKNIILFVNQLNWNFFIGKSNYSEEKKQKILTSSAYQIIAQKMPEMKAYLDSLIENNQDSWHVEIKYN